MLSNLLHYTKQVILKNGYILRDTYFDLLFVFIECPAGSD